MDPFSSKDILQSYDVNVIDSLEWQGFKLDNHLHSETFKLANIEKPKINSLKTGHFHLPLTDIPLDEIDICPSPTISSDDDQQAAVADSSGDNSDDDIWDVACLSESTFSNHLLSWDRFYNHNACKPAARYLSETEPRTFNKILSGIWHAEHGVPLSFARQDHFHQALINLVLGRSSQFFVWNMGAQCFERLLDNFAVSGYSPNFTSTICETFCKYGSSFKILKLFCRSENGSSPTMYALRTSMLEVLQSTERHISIRILGDHTIVELNTIVQKCSELLAPIQQLMHVARSLPNDERHLLSALVRSIENSWMSYIHLRPLLSQLAARILDPVVQTTAANLGLCTKHLGDDHHEGWILADLLPEWSAAYTETTTCFATARENGTQIIEYHKLLPTLSIVHRWSEIAEIQHIVNGIEIMAQADSRCSVRVVTDVQQHTAYNTAAPSSFDDPFKLDLELTTNQPVAITNQVAEKDPMFDLVSEAFQNETLHTGPDLSPLQALQMSLAPFVQVQHRTSSYALMRVLFLQQDLIAHLDLLYTFQLFGSGSFASQLSRALFNADQSNAEGRRKDGLTAGLRLEDREAWPPASSELRLVLIGLLSEAKGIGYVRQCMSFAIRDLPDDQLELCRNVNSIHALDFLRLVYMPSNSVIELIITPHALEKYDRIFKHLLVLLRLHTLSQNLMARMVCHHPTIKPQAPYRRFCMTLHHLSRALLDFALNVAITIPWKKFSTQMKTINTCLTTDDYQQSMHFAGSIAQIRDYHEDTIDEMLRSLLLKKKQAKAYDTLCVLLNSSLKIASDSAGLPLRDLPTDAYLQFYRVKDLWLSQTADVSKGALDPALQRLDHLLLMLEFSKENH